MSAWDRLRALRSVGASLSVYVGPDREARDAYTVEESDQAWELYVGRSGDAHGAKIIKAPKESDEIACYWPTINQSAWIERILNDGADLLTMALAVPTSVLWDGEGYCYACTLHINSHVQVHDDGCAWQAAMNAKRCIEERYQPLAHEAPTEEER